MKTIPLTKGFEAIVDDEDYEELSKHKWTACVGRKVYRTHVLAYRQEVIGGKTTWIAMHRAILSAPAGKMVDHVDRNPLNNQRSNLRLANGTQNNANQCKRTPHKRPPTSRFRGVCRTGKTWSAYMRTSKISKYLGCFRDEFNAATAWNFAAADVYGEEFVNFNRPTTPEMSWERNF